MHVLYHLLNLAPFCHYVNCFYNYLKLAVCISMYWLFIYMFFPLPSIKFCFRFLQNYSIICIIEHRIYLFINRVYVCRNGLLPFLLRILDDLFLFWDEDNLHDLTYSCNTLLFALLCALRLSIFLSGCIILLFVVVIAGACKCSGVDAWSRFAEDGLQSTAG